MLFSQELEELIDAVLQDGTITQKERATLHKRAQSEGADPDEVDIVIEARLNKQKKQTQASRVAPLAGSATPPPPPPEAKPEPAQSAGNTFKYGTVLKCPNCGTRIKGGSAVCPSCHYTFHGISANASIERLNAKLEAFDKQNNISSDVVSFGKNLGTGCLAFCLWPIAVPILLLKSGNKPIYRRKFDLISNFPVPNTRADLLDFLALVQQRANSTAPKNGTSSVLSNEDQGYAYWLLYCNCINKARINFADDSSFASFFSFYEREHRRSKGIMAFLNRNTKIFLIILWIIAFGAYVWYDQNYGEASKRKERKEREERVVQIVNNEDETEKTIYYDDDYYSDYEDDEASYGDNTTSSYDFDAE